MLWLYWIKLDSSKLWTVVNVLLLPIPILWLMYGFVLLCYTRTFLCFLYSESLKISLNFSFIIISILK